MQNGGLPTPGGGWNARTPQEEGGSPLPPPGPPSPPDHGDQRGKRNLQEGNSCWAIFGTQFFGARPPPPPPPRSNTSRGGGVLIGGKPFRNTSHSDIPSAFCTPLALFVHQGHIV